MESAKIVAWHKKVGEEVKQGEELFEIETEKLKFLSNPPTPESSKKSSCKKVRKPRRRSFGNY